MSRNSIQGILRFGPFELSSCKRMLWRDGVTLPLGGRAFDLLVYLVERPGEVIENKELIDHVWSDVTVAEGSLRVHVAAIRKALADGQFGNRYIANVKGRGYSFIGSVVRLEDSTENASRRPVLETNRVHILVLVLGAFDALKSRVHPKEAGCDDHVTIRRTPNGRRCLGKSASDVKRDRRIRR